jgi:hypothetical protein
LNDESQDGDNEANQCNIVAEEVAMHGEIPDRRG